MRNGLRNPKSVSIKKVSTRIKVLNSYPKQLPKPENMSFSSGEMIDVVIEMIPNSWCKNIAQKGTKPREIEFEKLITHVEIHE